MIFSIWYLKFIDYNVCLPSTLFVGVDDDGVEDSALDPEAGKSTQELLTNILVR